jgi:hypothetical protein
MIMTTVSRMTGTAGSDDNSLVLGSALLTTAGVVLVMIMVTVIRVH